MLVPKVTILQGDAISCLSKLPSESIQCCVTSPPYWGLRDYGTPGQLGLEKTPEEYIEKMVGVFREVRRTLRTDGTLWLNMGDSYYGGGGAHKEHHANPGISKSAERNGVPASRGIRGGSPKHSGGMLEDQPQRRYQEGLKNKDLCMIPARLALALQADGWWLRSDIIWAKPNPMPESCTDRPTTAHEHIFLLTKAAKYFYDAEAVKEPHKWGHCADKRDVVKAANTAKGKKLRYDGSPVTHQGSNWGVGYGKNGRNLRSVWTIATAPFPGSHFAVFPPAIPERCIKAGSKEGDTILDPFSGAGTTAMVAAKLGRNAIGIELNPEYVAMSVKRLKQELGMLVEIIT